MTAHHGIVYEPSKNKPFARATDLEKRSFYKQNLHS
jgi:hypothetical protein